MNRSVALVRRQSGTAKDISEAFEVPRTRVYDAIRVLESKGLVEIQQSNPQVFRAVSIDEAINTLRTEIQDALSGVEVFVSGLNWLNHSPLPGDDTEISRLLLADRETILVSSFTEARYDGREHEQGVCGRGFDNGLIAIIRRLMATGLLVENDPREDEA